jgi:uncharacterized protein (DUF4415 family)
MTESKAGSGGIWVDPDDAPEWTEEMFAEAELAVGGVVIRPGKWRRAGRPPQGDLPKQQITLRLDPDVIDRFKAGGPGWQSRMNAALRKAVGLA